MVRVVEEADANEGLGQKGPRKAQLLSPGLLVI